MRLYYQIFVSSRAATILRQRGADDRFSSSALPRADHQKRWSAPRSSEAATKPAPHYRNTVVCGEAALGYHWQECLGCDRRPGRALIVAGIPSGGGNRFHQLSALPDRLDVEP